MIKMIFNEFKFCTKYIHCNHFWYDLLSPENLFPRDLCPHGFCPQSPIYNFSVPVPVLGPRFSKFVSPSLSPVPFFHKFCPCPFPHLKFCINFVTVPVSSPSRISSGPSRISTHFCSEFNYLNKLNLRVYLLPQPTYVAKQIELLYLSDRCVLRRLLSCIDNADTLEVFNTM